MAVYTRVPVDALARFLAGFDVGGLVSAKGIAEGVENTTYLIDTAADRFVLTLYEKRVAAADLPYFVALADHLVAAGQPVPAVVRDRTGQAIGTLGGRPACLYRFAPGVGPDTPDEAQARAAGEALGSMHRALARFAPVRPNALGPAAWRRLAGDLGADLDRIEPGLAGVVADALDRLEGGWPDDLPRGTIHADLFPDNVLMLGDRVSAVIDWTFACTDIRAYDLAIAHGAWAFDGEGRRYDPAIGAALVAGYDVACGLSDAERAALPMLAQGAALRFLLTRAWDWLHTPADAIVRRKDPAPYRRRLAFYADPTQAEVWR